MQNLNEIVTVGWSFKRAATENVTPLEDIRKTLGA